MRAPRCNCHCEMGRFHTENPSTEREEFRGFEGLKDTPTRKYFLGGSKLFAHAVAGASLRAQKALAAAEESGPEQDFNEFHHRALPWEPRPCGFPTKRRCWVDSLKSGTF